MRQYIILFIAIVIIVFGGIFEIKYLEKSVTFFSSEIDYIQNAIENENYSLASEQLQNTTNSWNIKKKIWDIFVNNEDINEIEESLAELKANINFKEKEESGAIVGRLKAKISLILQRQEIKIENIF